MVLTQPPQVRRGESDLQISSISISFNFPDHSARLFHPLLRFSSALLCLPTILSLGPKVDFDLAIRYFSCYPRLTFV